MNKPRDNKGRFIEKKDKSKLKSYIIRVTLQEKITVLLTRL